MHKELRLPGVGAVHFSFRDETAGVVMLSGYGWALHFLCYPEHWVWLHKWEEYDRSLEYYGLGPLALLVICQGAAE